jgi:hypothetical protein
MEGVAFDLVTQSAQLYANGTAIRDSLAQLSREGREIRLSAAVAELGHHIIGSEASLAVKRTVIDP